MTPRPVRNLAASVHQRLLSKSRESGLLFNDLLQHYAIERFLYRLAASPHVDDFVLKGALLFRVWDASSARPTRDIDLLGARHAHAAAMAETMRAILSVRVDDDGLIFEATSLQVSAIAVDADYEGVRVEFTARLGNARQPMQIDIGFGDRITPEPQPIEYPTILDMDAPRLRGYPPETVIAEKVQIMLRWGALSSRMKDYFDIWTLAQIRSFDGPTLARAIENTCRNRDTEVVHPIDVLSIEEGDADPRQPQWQAFRSRLGGISCPETLFEVSRSLSVFLGPVVAAVARGEVFSDHWPPGGPWSA